MRRLPGYSTAFVLAVLLFATTPVGTGVGLHQLDLVHPLFSHLHVIDGRVMTHEQMGQDRARSSAAEAGATRGPAFGAGSASDPGLDGLGLTSPLPGQPIAPVWHDLPAAWLITDVAPPPGREEAPPDPPPL